MSIRTGSRSCAPTQTVTDPFRHLSRPARSGIRIRTASSDPSDPYQSAFGIGEVPNDKTIR
jgi:hypothetical protein